MDSGPLLHQITSLNSANRKADQSLSNFQTGVGAAAHATLDTEQLISHLQVTLFDTLSSLPEAEGDVIPVSEVCELLPQIHGILDKAVSKQIGNSAHILAHLFNSVSRHCHEVWASQFPFLHSLMEVIPPTILIDLWHGFILWVCFSLFLLRGVARPDHRLDSNSQCRRDLCQGLCWGLVGHLSLRGLALRVAMRLIWVARSLLVVVFPPVLLSQEEKGSMGVGTPDVPVPSTSSSSSSSISATFQVGMLFKFLDQWRSITSNRFVLNIVWGHHLQLRSCIALFRDFWHFNVKAAAAHHPVIQKEVDELLAKGAIEPSSRDTGFYSSMFVVPKHTGGL